MTSPDPLDHLWWLAVFFLQVASEQDVEELVGATQFHIRLHHH